MKLSADVRQLYPELVRWRRHLHQHPEPSMKEYQTASYLKQALDSFAVPYQSVGDTGIWATITGAHPGPVTLLRADMDALEMADRKTCDYKSQTPGLHHACGHDGHTASLLGAAKILKARQQELHGTVHLCFQPGEEIGAGARTFVAAGLLDDVDTAFGIHLNSYLELGKVAVVPGPTFASCDILTIEVQGKASHAARPHEGADAALAAAAILMALQSVMSRRKDPLHPSVLSFGKLEAGTRYNVVADKAILEGTLRVMTPEMREHLLPIIEDTIHTTARSYGCEATLDRYNAANPLINDVDYTAFCGHLTEEVVGAENIVANFPLTLAADDFADFSTLVPGCYLRVGSRSGPATAYPHHHVLFDIDEESLMISTELYVRMAMEAHRYHRVDN